MTDDPIDGLPDSWTVTTHLDDHLTVLDRATGRSLLATAHPGRDRWRVRGLGGYGPDFPLLAIDVPFEDAVDALREEARAVEAGTPTTGTRDDRDDQDDDVQDATGQTGLGRWT